MRKTILTLATVTLLISALPARAVILLDTEYENNGFTNAEALAAEPQFKALMHLSGDAGTGSGVWIGNYEGHGYVLTAGHMFTPDMHAKDYDYISRAGRTYHGVALYPHPEWNGSEDYRTGYDFAIIQLSKPVTDAGSAPALYDGDEELDQTLVFMGYGCRGTGDKGQNCSIETGDRAAAAKGLIEKVVDANNTTSKHSDAGNYFGIWLPKEDGTLSNPLNDDGIAKPQYALSGLLGSGDSGGPAWIETDNGWAVAGINSNGNDKAAYGNKSWFARVSNVKDWIESIVPNAKFAD